MKLFFRLLITMNSSSPALITRQTEVNVEKEKLLILGVIKIICCAIVLDFILGISTVIIGIYGAIIGIIKFNNNCVHNSGIGNFELDMAMIILGFVYIPLGLFLCFDFCRLVVVGSESEEDRHDRKYEHRSKTSCLIFIITLFYILYAIVLFKSTCKQDDTLLFNTGLLLFIYYPFGILITVLIQLCFCTCQSIKTGVDIAYVDKEANTQ